MGWISPTSHFDFSGEWIDPTNGYDDNLATDTFDPEGQNWLELIHAAILCSKVRFYYISDSFGDALNVEIDVYYGGAWHTIHDGYAGGSEEWEEFEVGSTQTITKCRIQSTQVEPTQEIFFSEMDFWEEPAFQYKDIATRFKLWAQKFKDIATRFKLWVQTYKDIATRFKLVVQNYKDIATRLKLTVQAFIDIGTRFKLLAPTAYNDVSTRFFLYEPSWKALQILGDIEELEERIAELKRKPKAHFRI